MLIFPKAKTHLLISFCTIFSVLSLWNCFWHLHWKHWDFFFSAGNSVRLTKGAKTGSNLVEIWMKRFFYLQGDALDASRSQTCDVYSGPRASCQGKVPFVSPQVSVPVARFWPFVPPSLLPFTTRRPASMLPSEVSLLSAARMSRSAPTLDSRKTLTLVLL